MNELIPYLYALFLTLIIELPLYYVLTCKSKYKLIRVVVIILMNAITNISLNLIYLKFNEISYLIYILEIIVVLIERIILWSFLSRKKKELAYYLLYSFVANLISYLVGIISNLLLQNSFYLEMIFTYIFISIFVIEVITLVVFCSYNYVKNNFKKKDDQ